MGLRVNTNISSMASQRTLGQTNRELEKDMRSLSSGSRIIQASDDAAGLAISEKMKSVIRSARQAKRNATDSVSMMQVAEGGMNEIQNIMSRLRELSVQNASDTMGDTERRMSDMEYQQLKNEVERIARSTKYNGRSLLDGNAGSYQFQVDINNGNASKINFDASQADMTLSSLNIDSLDVTNKSGAQSSLAKIDNAMGVISRQRSTLGSIQSRLSSSSNNLYVFEQSQSEANSRIRDVDYAQASASKVKNTLLKTAGTEVLSQANNLGGNVEKLLF